MPYLHKCYRDNKNCLMYRQGKCIALEETNFNYRITTVCGEVIYPRQCPFYKVSKYEFKYAVIDKEREEVVEYAKTIDEARSIVRVVSGNYYGSGLNDKRYLIKDWKGQIWKLMK